VHDARTKVTLLISRVDGGPLESGTRQETVDQRATSVSPARMYDESSGLVHDDQMFVLEHHVDDDVRIRNSRRGGG
jgi:hypothetical protein